MLRNISVACCPGVPNICKLPVCGMHQTGGEWAAQWRLGLLLRWPKQLEECAKRKLRKFKYEVLHSDGIALSLTADWELIGWEKDLRILVDKELYVNQQCALAGMKAKLHCYKHNQQVKARGYSPLFSTC